MKFLFRLIWGVGVSALLAQPAVMRADTTSATPDFKEVYDLIRAHLAGETESDLDRAAVQGLLKQLHAKVSLVEAPSGTNSGSDKSLLTKSSTYEGPIGYFRVGRVEPGLAAQITAAFKELNADGKLKGVILDLRFASGHDYAAATAVADLFLTNDLPLLDWGKGVVNSKAKADAIALPVAVLVNHATAAAAEALAAILREADRALVLGGNTAGEATIDEEFPLKTGQRLRIATATIKLGSGETLSVNGVKPDIQVAVNPADEKSYFADPFKEIYKPLSLVANASEAGTNGSGGTNHASRLRPTEADLIRERKERPGFELEYSVSPEREGEVEKPVIRDPVLGRALDLIKGISVLRQTKPS